MKTKLLLGAAAAGLVMIGQAEAQDTIKIGVIQPLTGSVAYNGTSACSGRRSS
jgi:branched-chain amino acid transport system substrate-binding protein